MTTPTTITNNQTQDDPDRPLLVDVAEAATILAISRSSVCQLIWSEQLTPDELAEACASRSLNSNSSSPTASPKLELRTAIGESELRDPSKRSAVTADPPT